MKVIVVDLQNCYIRDWYKSVSFFSTASVWNNRVRMIHKYSQLKVQMRLTLSVHPPSVFISLFLRGSIKSGIKISKLSEPPTLGLLAAVLLEKKNGSHFAREHHRYRKFSFNWKWLVATLKDSWRQNYPSGEHYLSACTGKTKMPVYKEGQLSRISEKGVDFISMFKIQEIFYFKIWTKTSIYWEHNRKA